MPAYQDEAYFNARVMRWEPETIVQLPQVEAAFVALRPTDGAILSLVGIAAPTAFAPRATSPIPVTVSPTSAGMSNVWPFAKIPRTRLASWKPR